MTPIPIDDASLHVSLIAWLTAAGHAVATADDGLEGARRFRARCTDVVLMGMMMLHSGLMSTRVQHSQSPTLRVIAMTAGGSHRLDYARHRGVQRILNRLFAPEQLTAAIADILADGDVPSP